MNYIIDAKPKQKNINRQSVSKILELLNSNQKLENDQKEVLLDYFVSEFRKIVKEEFNIDTLENPLTNRCDLAQYIMGKLLEKSGHIEVYPKDSGNIFKETCIGHSFLICKIQNTPYLIDPTYQQFFLEKDCSMKNYQIINKQVLKTPNPGYFVIRSGDKSIEVAKKIIENGYVELDLESAKVYGDSFNKTQTGSGIFMDNIPGDVYLEKLLKKSDKYAVDNLEKLVEIHHKFK